MNKILKEGPRKPKAETGLKANSDIQSHLVSIPLDIDNNYTTEKQNPLVSIPGCFLRNFDRFSDLRGFQPNQEKLEIYQQYASKHYTYIRECRKETLPLGSRPPPNLELKTLALHFAFHQKSANSK